MTNPPSDRLINLLGAMALGVADRVRQAAAEASESGGETAAALVVIGHEPRLSIDQLRRVLRLSHAGAVRIVDRLAAQGLVDRQPSPDDRRVAALVLTEAGEAQRAHLLALRRSTLEPLLTAIPPEDRQAFERVAERILSSLPDSALTALSTCRFCDDQRCPDCPMDMFGSATTTR